MIVKIQTPLMTNDPHPLALVYNKGRTFEILVPITKDIIKAMKGEPKKFFEVKVNTGNPEKIEIVKETQWQNW